MTDNKITETDRMRADAVLHDLTFGGHSQDGAVEMLAQAFAAARAEAREEERRRIISGLRGLIDLWKCSRCKATRGITTLDPLPEPKEKA